MENTKIKNIIFDIGNVLVDFRWAEFLHEKGFEGKVFEEIANASVLSSAWAELDRGVLSDAEVIEGFVKNAPHLEAQIHAAYDDMTGIVALRDYALSWVKEFKEKGYKVYYLSNFSGKVETECAESLVFLPEMDGGILSYRDRLIKPDAAIYETLLTRYRLVPEECVFLDDTKVNIDAALKAGMKGIVFTTKEKAMEELEALGVCLI